MDVCGSAPAGSGSPRIETRRVPRGPDGTVRCAAIRRAQRPGRLPCSRISTGPGRPAGAIRHGLARENLEDRCSEVARLEVAPASRSAAGRATGTDEDGRHPGRSPDTRLRRGREVPDRPLGPGFRRADDGVACAPQPVDGVLGTGCRPQILVDDDDAHGSVSLRPAGPDSRTPTDGSVGVPWSAERGPPRRWWPVRSCRGRSGFGHSPHRRRGRR